MGTGREKGRHEGGVSSFHPSGRFSYRSDPVRIVFGARAISALAANRVSGDGAEALPATAIYDPELTLDLPARVSAASGMNAMAHAVESLYGVDTNPVVETMAEEAVRLLGSSLPRLVHKPRDLEA